MSDTKTALDLDTIEARAKRCAADVPLPECECEKRGHAPCCYDCYLAYRAAVGPTFEELGRGDALALVAAVRGRDVDLARLRALVEQHEERARVHAEERAAHYAEMARVTGECETLRRTLALSQESLAAASSGRRVTVVDEIERLQRERDAAHAAIADLRQEIGDAADTLHRLSLAQQRIASAGDRGAWATSGAFARAAQIVAGIGDPAARAAIGGAP